MPLNNLCYQKKAPSLRQNPTGGIPCKDAYELMEKDPDYKLNAILFGNCFIYKEPKIPELKRCEKNQKSGDYYENCCPANEYDTYFLEKYMEKRGIESYEVLFYFFNLVENKRLEILDKIKEIEKKQELKTETKSVYIPVGKSLKVEEMGLLEANIFGTFIIVKSLFF